MESNDPTPKKTPAKLAAVPPHPCDKNGSWPFPAAFHRSAAPSPTHFASNSLLNGTGSGTSKAEKAFRAYTSSSNSSLSSAYRDADVKLSDRASQRSSSASILDSMASLNLAQPTLAEAHPPSRSSQHGEQKSSGVVNALRHRNIKAKQPRFQNATQMARAIGAQPGFGQGNFLAPSRAFGQEDVFTALSGFGQANVVAAPPGFAYDGSIAPPPCFGPNRQINAPQGHPVGAIGPQNAAGRPPRPQGVKKGFQPMNKVFENVEESDYPSEETIRERLQAGVSPNYKGDPWSEKNRSADIPEDENCAFWLVNLPADISETELLSEIRNVGRVFALVINRATASEQNVQGYLHKNPNMTRHDLHRQQIHETSAAKLIFFTVAEAWRFMLKYGQGWVIRNKVVKVMRNRHKTAQQSLPTTYTRALLVRGPSENLNEGDLINTFRTIFTFELDTSKTLFAGGPGEISIVEIRFGSYRCQAQTAFLALKYSNVFEGLGLSATFTVDPCAYTVPDEFDGKPPAPGVSQTVQYRPAPSQPVVVGTHQNLQHRHPTNQFLVAEAHRQLRNRQPNPQFMAPEPILSPANPTPFIPQPNMQPLGRFGPHGRTYSGARMSHGFQTPIPAHLNPGYTSYSYVDQTPAVYRNQGFDDYGDQGFSGYGILGHGIYNNQGQLQPGQTYGEIFVARLQSQPAHQARLNQPIIPRRPGQGRGGHAQTQHGQQNQYCQQWVPAHEKEDVVEEFWDPNEGKN
ncbi:hypothetical protein B0H63DRAFT_288959 [Podospora didyma]|uniref:Uncharacterized protein n=1 Tax=Podospora didyma TaxID=330526 RepID=A0AAE0N655_9PEZI|nr:hypothetical protein B0H63DRAFT_288959 [Podospora didyma]